MSSSLHLSPSKDKVSMDEVLSIAPTGRLLACDFKITGVEEWDEKPWGYESGRITNIDHHAETLAMRRHVSSANLALIYVQENGVAKNDETVVIDHTDCDSVLAAAIVRGDLEPLEVFGQAAIAADHTGEENAIADLLQALNDWRDYEYSLHCLKILLEGGVLPDAAQAALSIRFKKRERAAQLVGKGVFEMQNGIAWAVLGDSIDGEFFPPLLPNAKLIVMFYPRAKEPGKWNNKVRLGNAAPEGFSIHDLIGPIDEEFGGRWNAGSNKRGKGSPLTPQEYIAQL